MWGKSAMEGLSEAARLPYAIMIKCNPCTISHQSQIRQKEISPMLIEFGSLRKDSLPRTWCWKR